MNETGSALLRSELTAPGWLERHGHNLPGWFRAIAGEVAQVTGKTLAAEMRRNLLPEGGLGMKPRTGRLFRSVQERAEKDGGIVVGMKVAFATVPGIKINTIGLRPMWDRPYPAGKMRGVGWIDRAQQKAINNLMPAFRQALLKGVR